MDYKSLNSNINVKIKELENEIIKLKKEIKEIKEYLYDGIDYTEIKLK